MSYAFLGKGELFYKCSHAFELKKTVGAKLLAYPGKIRSQLVSAFAPPVRVLQTSDDSHGPLSLPL